MTQASPFYAAIDLGSNSFHMLIVRELSGSVQTIAKIKRKVRLAAGLDSDHVLDNAAMVRGWQCLSLFAEQLRDIPAEQVKIVGTATLRYAKNAQTFVEQAEKILGLPIEIVSGDVEARLIYRGVAHTSSGKGKRLVIDIGGASTELVIGEHSEALLLNSLDMGCVTWLKRYFNDGLIDLARFRHAVEQAAAVVEPILSDYRRLGWQTCVGASGTIQALQEVITAQGMDERLSLEKLQLIQQQVFACSSIDELNLVGLEEERKPVFVSGLAILTALFECLQMQELTLSGGALREGLVYGLLGQLEVNDVRRASADSFIQRHFIDREHAERVTNCARDLAQQLQPQLSKRAISLLKWACMFHEVGLNIEFKKAPQHAAYILDHSDLPGFTGAQKQLLSVLLLNQRGKWQQQSLEQQCALPQAEAICLARILRLSIIICMRRTQGSVPKMCLLQDQQDWNLCFSPGWNQQHPLRAAELELEAKMQNQQGLALEISELLV